MNRKRCQVLPSGKKSDTRSETIPGMDRRLSAYVRHPNVRDVKIDPACARSPPRSQRGELLVMTAWVPAASQRCRGHSSAPGRQRQEPVVVQEGCQMREAPQERPLALESGLAQGQREGLEGLLLGEPQERPALQQRTVSPVQGETGAWNRRVSPVLPVLSLGQRHWAPCLPSGAWGSGECLSAPA